MNAMLIDIGRREYNLLGRMLVKQHPEIAEDLLSSLQRPFDTDLQNIPRYFKTFCELCGIADSDLLELRYDKDMVGNKRLFIACMLFLYDPGIFNSSVRDVKYGLSTAISKLLHHNNGYIGSTMRDVITWYKAYDEFRAQVDEMVEKLKGGGDE